MYVDRGGTAGTGETVGGGVYVDGVELQVEGDCRWRCVCRWGGTAGEVRL